MAKEVRVFYSLIKNLFHNFLKKKKNEEGQSIVSCVFLFPEGKKGHKRFNGNVIIYRVLSEYKVYLLTLLAIKSLVRKDKYIRYTYV
jgi:hypothetical protein